MPVQLPDPPVVAEHESFGLGLNLRDGPDAVEQGHAIDALNTRYTERATLSVRPGFGSPINGGVSGGHQPRAIVPFSDHGASRMLILGHTQARLCGDDGVTISELNLGASAGAAVSVARMGAPTQESVYWASSNVHVHRHLGFTGLQKCDGSGGVPALGAGDVVGVSPDGRLMLAGFDVGSVLPTPTTGPAFPAADPSMVILTAPHDPSVTNGNDFVRLRPGDSEKVTAIATWREQTFVFKQSCFWVWGVPSTLNSGAAQFHRRPVDTGIGLAQPGAICVGRDGVYFLGKNGIYRTTGGPPELLSDLVSPIFDGRTARYFRGGALERDHVANVRLHWHDELLYVTYPVIDAGSLPVRQLVLDTRYGWWSVYNLPAVAMASYRDQLAFVDDATVVNEHRIWRVGEEHLGDGEGVYEGRSVRAFTARWRSGWFDFGSPLVKTLDAVRLTGAGTVTVGLSRDFLVGFDAERTVVLGAGTDLWGDGASEDLWGGGGVADAWGPSYSLDTKLVRRALRGIQFSFQLQAQVGNVTAEDRRQRMAIHRATHYIRGAAGVAAIRRDR